MRRAGSPWIFGPPLNTGLAIMLFGALLAAVALDRGPTLVLSDSLADGPGSDAADVELAQTSFDFQSFCAVQLSGDTLTIRAAGVRIAVDVADAPIVAAPPPPVEESAEALIAAEDSAPAVDPADTVGHLVRVYGVIADGAYRAQGVSVAAQSCNIDAAPASPAVAPIAAASMTPTPVPAADSSGDSVRIIYIPLPAPAPADSSRALQATPDLGRDGRFEPTRTPTPVDLWVDPLLLTPSPHPTSQFDLWGNEIFLTNTPRQQRGNEGDTPDPSSGQPSHEGRDGSATRTPGPPTAFIPSSGRIGEPARIPREPTPAGVDEPTRTPRPTSQTVDDPTPTPTPRVSSPGGEEPTLTPRPTRDPADDRTPTLRPTRTPRS